jgi:transposase-like protein
MQQRQELIALYRTGRFTVTDLAAHFGVSRKTVHKWVARVATGDTDLLERSRAPKRHPNATHRRSWTPWCA